MPRRVFGSYSQAFNKAYRRTGTLFEGKYQAIHVDSDTYLRQLCRYIHRNPVKHGLALQPEDWPFSNYQTWVADQPEEPIVYEVRQAHFSSAEAYRAFVREEPAQQSGIDLPPDL